MKFFLALLLCLKAAVSKTMNVDQLIAKMEGDVLELAEALEEEYQNRCGTALDTCAKANYDECTSEYPNPVCLNTELKVCTGKSCSSLVDESISVVSLPREVANGWNGNPTDEQVIESICYSRQLDTWFKEKRARDKAIWASYNVESPQMFFGGNGGLFRIFPARHARTCGGFDPRERPWYVAASSGPKNVILVLDISGSMQRRRLELLKEASKTIVETLTVADRVAIVVFESESRVIADKDRRMLVATKENIDMLTKEIDSLVAFGQTNFFDAFEDAFEVFENTLDVELNNPCNSAMLFVTDGEMSLPEDKTEDDVIDLVQTRLAQTTEKAKKPVLLFTYSVSEDDSTVHLFPKRLACSAGQYGVFSKIVDDRNIVQALTSYYLLFALGLGVDSNEESRHVAWVEPFTFYPSGVLGTTVSAPVYDRSAEPHTFLGVVGFAFTLSAIDQAMGVQAGSQETLDRVISQSVASCPALSLGFCELERFRLQNGNDDSLCNPGNCTEEALTSMDKCTGDSNHPENVFENHKFANRDFPNRACCRYGENTPTDQCSAEALSTGALAGIVVGAVIAGLVLVGAVYYFMVERARQRKDPEDCHRDPPHAPSETFPDPIPPPNNPPPSAPLEKPNDTTTEAMCVLCSERPMDCILSPCGHQMCCTECGHQLQACPCCKIGCNVRKI